MGRSSSIVDTPSGKGFESYIMPNFVQIHEQNAGRRTTRSGTTAMNWTLLKDLQYELKFVRKKKCSKTLRNELLANLPTFLVTLSL